MKKIIITKVSVGVAHPLYNKEVEVEVLNDHTGYDGKQTYVRTIKEVLYKDMPILIYDKNGKFLREEKKPPYYEKWEGYALQS